MSWQRNVVELLDSCGVQLPDTVTQVHEVLSEMLPSNAPYHINLATVIASLPLHLLLLPPFFYYLEILIRLQE